MFADFQNLNLLHMQKIHRNWTGTRKAFIFHTQKYKNWQASKNLNGVLRN